MNPFTHSARNNSSSREERTRLPQTGPRSSSAGKLQHDLTHGLSSARTFHVSKTVRTESIYPVETSGTRDIGESASHETLPVRLKRLQIDDEAGAPLGNSRGPVEPFPSGVGDHSTLEMTNLDPDSMQFLREMQSRYNTASVSERISASRQRAREGSEAVLTFELLLESPISENDPALVAGVSATLSKRPVGSRRLPPPAPPNRDNSARVEKT
jgi:hypothetical protein